MRSADRAYIYVDDSGSMWGRSLEVCGVLDEYDDPNVYRVGDYVGCWAGGNIGAGKPNIKAMCAHADTVGAEYRVFITDEHGDWTPDELTLLKDARFITRVLDPHKTEPPPVQLQAGHMSPAEVWNVKDEVMAWEAENKRGWATLSKDERKLIMEEVRQGLRNLAENLTDNGFEDLVSSGLERIDNKSGDFFTFRMFIKGGSRG